MNLQNKTFIKGVIFNFVLVAQLIFIGQAYSAGPVGKIDNVDFSFEGVFGTYDKSNYSVGFKSSLRYAQGVMD